MMDELTQKEFLERTPPGTQVTVRDLEIKDANLNTVVRTPDIELHCPVCAGQRFFTASERGTYLSGKPFDDFLHYFCRNCRRHVKVFAIHGHMDDEKKRWIEAKYGEEPAFGPPTPARVISLIGPYRDEFLKGRRCENQGLGVAAFAYYRRVVESQKNRIFDEVIRVSRHLSADQKLIDDLEAAKREVQFTRAVDAIKQGLPQSLLINGYNPLTLLHGPLSKGLHELSDAECLELATSIRVVLIEFSERLSLAMKDEAELNEAVSRLAGNVKRAPAVEGAPEQGDPTGPA
jgi:hypothetical protein